VCPGQQEIVDTKNGPTCMTTKQADAVRNKNLQNIAGYVDTACTVVTFIPRLQFLGFPCGVKSVLDIVGNPTPGNIASGLCSYTHVIPGKLCKNH
jgi:hypothetical protein